jgi:MerR family transcriptional regulator, light-induced transcriptional regulator
MKSYQIADLELLTGIKAHTIRIWEKRFALIVPHRTTTNIRYYDDEQVKKLLNVSTLLSMGYKISKIAKRSDKEINKLIEDVKKVSPEDALCASYINELTSAMVSFNEEAFDMTFTAAVASFGVYEAMLKVFYPFLYKTGVLWSINEAMPAEEHFASGIIRRKLMAAIDGLPNPSKKNKLFILFLPPEEWHETGLLFSDYLIRSKGYRTIYLGQNVPVENVITIAHQLKPNYLLTFQVVRRNEREFENQLLQLNLKSKATEILVCSKMDFAERLKKSKKITQLRKPLELLTLLK